MKKQIAICIVLLIILILPARTQAQGGIKLEFLSIELWSEFDQPSMLVIHEFVVASDVPLPAEVKWRFPKEGNLVAVAYQENGLLLNTPFESSAGQGDWQTITLNVATHDTYHIEYYAPLVREEARRSFAYTWSGDYSIGELRLSVSLPADSVNVQTTPELTGFETVAGKNQMIGRDVQSDLDVGGSYEFTLNYERTSDELTDPNQVNQVNPSEPLGSETDGRVSVNNLPWIIGGIGIALIGFGMFFYWRSTRTDSGPSKRTRKRRQSPEAQDDSQPVYCHECGTRANTGDRFCRTCGSRLRTE